MGETVDLAEYTFATEMQALQTRMHAVLAQQQRVTEISWRSEGMAPTSVERQEGMDDVFHDLVDDRSESSGEALLAQLGRQMEQMMQQRETERSQHQSQGIGF